MVTPRPRIEAMAPPSQGQPVRDQPHQGGSLATNDCGPPQGPTVGVARAAAQAALDASFTNPPPSILSAVGERIRAWVLWCFGALVVQ